MCGVHLPQQQPEVATFFLQIEYPPVMVADGPFARMCTARSLKSVLSVSLEDQEMAIFASVAERLYTQTPIPLPHVSYYQHRSPWHDMQMSGSQPDFAACRCDYKWITRGCGESLFSWERQPPRGTTSSSFSSENWSTRLHNPLHHGKIRTALRSPLTLTNLNVASLLPIVFLNRSTVLRDMFLAHRRAFEAEQMPSHRILTPWRASH
jgi:hypothetical protein